MKTTTILCDICNKECKVPEFSVFSGAMIKINEELKPGHLVFEIHICPDETEKIYNFIQNLNAKNNNTGTVDTESNKTGTDQ